MKKTNEALDEGSPPVPLPLMEAGYALYHSVYYRNIPFVRTPEDMHSPLMADIRPHLRVMPPAAVDAALAVQRYLLLQGGDAVRFLNSIMNRSAVLLKLEDDVRFADFHHEDPKLAGPGLLRAVASLPLHQMLEPHTIIASASKHDAELRAANPTDLSSPDSAAFHEVMSQLRDIDPSKTLH